MTLNIVSQTVYSFLFDLTVENMLDKFMFVLNM